MFVRKSTYAKVRSVLSTYLKSTYANVRKQNYVVYKARISKVPMYTNVRSQHYVCKSRVVADLGYRVSIPLLEEPWRYPLRFLWLEHSHVFLGTAQQFLLTKDIRDLDIAEQKGFPSGSIGFHDLLLPALISKLFLRVKKGIDLM